MLYDEIFLWEPGILILSSGMLLSNRRDSFLDDKVPASLEGQEDVLLADGEYVLRAKTADKLTKAFGGGFLDAVNQSEDNAPRVIREYAAKTATA